jgi:hypothetical protein
MVEVKNICNRGLFSQVIDALISEGTPRERLSEADVCIQRLEDQPYEADLPLLEELKRIRGDFAKAVEQNPHGSGAISLWRRTDDKLTDDLFSLYIDLSGGALIS